MRKLYNFFLLTAALLCLPMGVKAESTVTVSDGTGTNRYSPFYMSYVDDVRTHSQVLYSSSTLAAEGLTEGTITALKFYASTKNASYGNAVFVLQMAEVEETSLSGFLTPSFSEVYTGALSSDENGDMLITLNSGFEYSGEKNLLLDFTLSTKGTWKDTYFYGTTVSGASYYSYYSSGTRPNANAWLPKTTFTYEDAGSATCAKPTLTAGDVTAKTAAFSWTAGDEETEWQYICLPASEKVDWSAEGVVKTSATEVTLEGLSANTAYKFYLRAYCSEEDQSGDVTASFTTLKSCYEPTTLAVVEAETTSTSAKITWAASGKGETQYQYVYEVWSDETPDWTAAVTTSERSATLTGLNPKTYYQVWVRSYCGENDESAAVTTYFATACGAEALPFSEDFSGGIDCWTTQSIDASTGLNSGTFMFSYNSNPPQYLISPELATSDKEVKVTFDYYARSANYPETFQVGYSTTTNDVESAFTWGDVVTSTNTSAEEYAQVLPAGVKYVAIKYTANGQWALYIDNFSVAEYEAPACEMPTGLAASEITAESAKIAWTSDATAWKLQTSADGENWTDVEAEITNPYTLTGLTENTTYYVRVCANCGENGDSEWTAAINFTTDCAVKSLPFATEGFEEGTPACWNAASQWAVYTYEGHSSSSSMRFNASTTADLTLPAIALSDKAQLTFWRMSSYVSCSVYVNDGETETKLGDFAKSSSWVQATVDLSAYAGKTVTIIIRGNYYQSSRYLYIDDVAINYAPVAAVTNVVASPANGSATVTWECAEEDATFSLQYRTQGEGDWTLVTNINAKTYTIDGLTNNTAYEVQVKAIASANRQSDWTASATVTPVDCPTVQSVTFGAATYNSVVVNWTANAAGTWTLRYQPGEEGWTEKTGIEGNSYTLTDLETGTSYSVEVKASCAGDEAYVLAATTFTPVYSVPATATVTNATDTSAVATWAAVEDTPNGYKYIVVARGETPNWEDASVKATDALTAELSELSGLTDYDFYVAALYGAHLGAPVKAEFATVAYAPKNLTAGEITTTTATFTWEANGAATQYQWSTDNTNWSDPASDLTATATGLTAATTYTFYVRSYYAAGKFSDATTLAFTTECDTYALPFAVEGFDHSGALPNCWDNSEYTGTQWKMDSYNYYKSSPYSARYNARTATGNSADLKTPAINLSEKAVLTFYYKNNSSVTAEVLVYDGANTDTVLAAIPATSGTATIMTAQAIVDLSDHVGKTVNIIFRGHGKGSTSAYLDIDDVEITYKSVATPTALAVEASDKQATISWTNIEEDATYNLRHKATADAEWTSVNGVTNPYVLGGLTNDTEYEVQVQAFASEHRVSEWTASATFTPVACASIETVTFGDKTYNSVVVNWTATAAGKWDVRYKAAGEAEYTEAGTNLTVQTITLEGLKTNVAYTIEVKAACSDEWKAAEALTLRYTAPTNITASNIKDVTATLSWDAVADAPEGKYRYMLKEKLDFYADDWAQATEVTGTTVNLTNLKPATTYRVYVYTVYGENEHSGVTEGSLTTGTVAPYDLQVSEITTTSAHFTWQFDGYYGCCYQYAVGDDPDALEWKPTDEYTCFKNFTLNGLQPGTTYTVYVRSDYGNDIFGDSVSVSFTTLCAAKALPFAEDFEQAGLPNCWESDAWSASVAAGKWSRDNSYSHSGYALRFNANTANSASISTPEIVLDKKAELSFYIRNAYGQNAGYVSGKVVAVDVENEANKVEADFINSNAENLSEQTVDLSDLKDKTVQIVFHAEGVSANASLYIDDVTVTEIPETPSSIGNTNADGKKVVKLIENDRLVIIRDGVKYNAQGVKIN